MRAKNFKEYGPIIAFSFFIKGEKGGGEGPGFP
jgi:hypothetical protein